MFWIWSTGLSRGARLLNHLPSDMNVMPAILVWSNTGQTFGFYSLTGISVGKPKLKYNVCGVRAIPFEILSGRRNGKNRWPPPTYFFFCRPPPHIFLFFQPHPRTEILLRASLSKCWILSVFAWRLNLPESSMKVAWGKAIPSYIFVSHKNAGRIRAKFSGKKQTKFVFYSWPSFVLSDALCPLMFLMFLF